MEKPYTLKLVLLSDKGTCFLEFKQIAEDINSVDIIVPSELKGKIRLPRHYFSEEMQEKFQENFGEP